MLIPITINKAHRRSPHIRMDTRAFDRALQAYSEASERSMAIALNHMSMRIRRRIGPPKAEAFAAFTYRLHAKLK